MSKHMPDILHLADLAKVSVPDAIERHRLAYIQLNAACEHRNRIYDEARKTEPEIQVILGVRPDGELGGFQLYGVKADDLILADIEDYHRRKERLFADPWAKHFTRDPAQIAEAIATSKQHALDSLAEAERTLAAHYDAAGLNKAGTALHDAEEEEYQARLVLIMAVPADAAEVEARSAYCATSDPFFENWTEEDSARIVRDMLKGIAVTTNLDEAEAGGS